MQPVSQSNSEKKTTNASAQALGGKGGTVAFASAAMQRKMNESGTEEPLTAHTGSHNMQTEPFNPATAPGTVQRIPTGDYADDYPAGDGMYWDTFDSEDHNGALVPSEVVAVMRNPGYGGVPSVDPPGWAWLKTKFGKLKGTWVRFHIINAELGGPGDDTDNLVPTLHALNHNGGWRTLEDNAKASATDEDDENDSTWTYVEVELGYDDDYPAGIPETIDARWGYEDDDGDWVQSGGNVHLAQNDPDDGDNNNYLPAAQITQGRLQELGCTLYEAQTLKGLIDAQYDDQDDFEQTAAQEEADDRIGMGGWYDVLNRIYVDEDDDIDGPYGIVVRNS
jgi:hypothetical protein